MLHKMPGYLLRLAFIVELWVALTFADCNFPAYLPRAGVWTSTFDNGGFLTVNVRRNLIDANYCHAPHVQCDQYERTCLQEVEPGKYLVEHMPKGDGSFNNQPQYMCIQFVNRSEYIVQIKSSPKLNWRNQDICKEEHLSLDNYPLLSPKLVNTKEVKCPLVGGYNMRINGPEGEMCYGKLVLPRLESECEAGDGMIFNFRHQSCLHENLKWKKKQRMQCVASWDHGDFTFVILRPPSKEFEAWCLRITNTPNGNGDERQMHLFMLPVCDPGAGNGHGQITETQKYLTISLQRFNIQSVCADEFEGCQKDQFCDSSVAEYCHRTCHKCKPEVSPCMFSESVQGEWFLDSEAKQKINIDLYEITIPGQGQFKCLTRNGTGIKNDKKDRTVLLHVFDNGCFPRYSCLEIRKTFPSVIQFRRGKSQDWPIFPIEDVKRQVCGDKRFFDQYEIAGNMRKYDIPFNTILHTSNYYNTDCRLPLDQLGFHGRSIFFTEGEQCNGCLTYDPSVGGDFFDVRPINCSKKAADHLRYICLANLDFEYNTKAVITGTYVGHVQPDSFLCWVFQVDGKSREIIVLNPAECTQVTLDRVMEGDINPVARFQVMDYLPGSCTAPLNPVQQIQVTPVVDPMDHQETPRPFYTDAPPRGQDPYVSNSDTSGKPGVVNNQGNPSKQNQNNSNTACSHSTLIVIVLSTLHILFKYVIR